MVRNHASLCSVWDRERRERGCCAGVLEGMSNDEGVIVGTSGFRSPIPLATSGLEGNEQWLGERKEEMPVSVQAEHVDKKSLRTRLEWIIASRLGADPARATLKRVNEFLIAPRRVGSGS